MSEQTYTADQVRVAVEAAWGDDPTAIQFANSVVKRLTTKPEEYPEGTVAFVKTPEYSNVTIAEMTKYGWEDFPGIDEALSEVRVVEVIKRPDEVCIAPSPLLMDLEKLERLLHDNGGYEDTDEELRLVAAVVHKLTPPVERVEET